MCLWIKPLRALSKVWTNLLHDLLLNPKCSSHWYTEDHKITKKTWGQPDYTFLSRSSSKRTNDIPFKVSGVMINAITIAIDNVFLFLT